MFEMEIEMFDAMDDDFIVLGFGSAHSRIHFSISVRFHSSRFNFFGKIWRPRFRSIWYLGSDLVSTQEVVMNQLIIFVM